MEMRWRIQLLGGLRAVQGDQVIDRFRTQKTGALLAYLAYHRDRAHPRDILIDLLWSESDLDGGRQNLSMALSSLRHQLEPPGTPRGTVLAADRHSVRLNPAVLTTDVAEFEAALESAQRVRGSTEQARYLLQTVGLYQGELLPGYYEDWILPEQERLSELYFQAVQGLIRHLDAAGELDPAIQHARRALGFDPLREEMHRELMRLYATLGQSGLALRQYRELVRLLKREDEAPSPATRALAEEIRRSADQASRRPEALVDSSPRPFSANLPLQLTRFIGRETEIAQVKRLLGVGQAVSSPSDGDGSQADGLSHCRLLTLTGLGGSGKTRLALEVAERLKAAFHGAVRFVSLAEVTDARRILDEVRDALGLPRSPTADPVEQIAAVLSGHPALLVLDNFEHLVPEGAGTVRMLLERVPALTCLVTSRRRLNLSVERWFPVPPLPTPNDADTPEQIARCESVQLFADRARAVRPDFEVTERNMSAVAALCRLLDGIPLALTLAAARVHMLTPTQMLAHQGDRFEWLKARYPDVPSRQLSLRAALDWSYQLLTPELQQILARLSVFRGGWTLAAAKAVCGDKGEGRRAKGENERAFDESCPAAFSPFALRPSPFFDVLDYLEELREYSLVEAAEAGEEIRYRLLDTLREYAGDRLKEAGEEKIVRARHRAFFLAFAEQAAPELLGANQKEWLDRLEREHDNLRAALEGCRTEEDVEAGLRLAGALGKFWIGHCHYREGRQWLEEMLAKSGSAPARLEALLGAGTLAFYESDYEAAATFAEESLALSRELKIPRALVHSISILGWVQVDYGEYGRARALFESGLALSREAGDTWGIALSLHSLGSVAEREGRYQQARPLLDESLSLFRQLGDAWGTSLALGRLGYLTLHDGNYPRATALYEETLELAQRLGHTTGIALALRALGTAARHQGEHVRSATLLRESLTLERVLGGKEAIAECLEGLAAVASGQGQARRAARLFGAAGTLREALGAPMPPFDRVEYEQCVATARAELGEAAFTIAQAEGRAMTVEQAIAAALEVTSVEC